MNSTSQPIGTYAMYSPFCSPQNNMINIEYERIKQLKQLQAQAALKQQNALIHQQMMFFQDFEVLDDVSNFTSYSPMSVDSPYVSSIPYQDHMVDDLKARKRAEHNAIERARRERLNNKYQQLANSLPNLQNDHRHSKGTIIERTLEYVKETVEKEERFQSEIDKLREANEALIVKMTNEIQTDLSY